MHNEGSWNKTSFQEGGQININRINKTETPKTLFHLISSALNVRAISLAYLTLVSLTKKCFLSFVAENEEDPALNEADRMELEKLKIELENDEITLKGFKKKKAALLGRYQPTTGKDLSLTNRSKIRCIREY